PTAGRELHEPAGAGVAFAGPDDVVSSVTVHIGGFRGDVVSHHRLAPVGAVVERAPGAGMGSPAGAAGRFTAHSRVGDVGEPVAVEVAGDQAAGGGEAGAVAPVLTRAQRGAAAAVDTPAPRGSIAPPSVHHIAVAVAVHVGDDEAQPARLQAEPGAVADRACRHAVFGGGPELEAGAGGTVRPGDPIDEAVPVVVAGAGGDLTRPVAAADALSVDRHLVEGHAEILVRRLLAAVVHVEPVRLDPDRRLAGPSELDPVGLERRGSVHPAAEGAVGDPGVVELDLAFDAVPLTR